MKTFLRFLLILFVANAYAEDCLRVEASVDNRNFIINGIQFSAKALCPNIEMGDEIVFVEGNPDGSSSDAIIVDMRSNEACSVWSQSPL